MDNKNTVTIKNYLKKYKVGIILYVVLQMLSAGMEVAITLLLAESIEKITLAQYKNGIMFLLIVLGCYVLRRLIYNLTDYVFSKYSNKITSDMNFDLAKQAFKLNSETYANHETGTFVQRIVYDPERLVFEFANMVNLITSIITSTTIMIYVSVLNIYIGLIIFAVLIVCFFIERKRVKTFKQNRQKTRQVNDRINTLTTEIVRSEKDIKSIGLEDKLSELSNSAYTKYRDMRYKTAIDNMLISTARNFIVEVAKIGLLILGVVLLDKALITFATFMIVYSNSDGLYNFIYCIGNLSTQAVEIKIAAERMFGLYDNKEFICEKFGDVNLEHVKGKIEFKNVCYAYKEYEMVKPEPKGKMSKRQLKKLKPVWTLTNKNTVFENLNFKIEPNTTVAFVGRSGSGKSTILNLISKMYEADGGEVLIDDVNINLLTKQTLRKSISLVNQFPYIFDATIKENLLLAKKDATDEEINTALKNAAFDEFVATLKNGINTKVGESGIKLSGGQKQRLAIARALLRNSSIIIFDESTSSLDNFAQESIKHSIDKLKGKSTIIIVAHRLSTIKNADKIYFLDNGKIEDSGTFDELFKRNKVFNQMFLVENLADETEVLNNTTQPLQY